MSNIYSRARWMADIDRRGRWTPSFGDEMRWQSRIGEAMGGIAGVVEVGYAGQVGCVALSGVGEVICCASGVQT